jgi:(E)-4-hydroxy-3-methylbut-2-enyl-diphosphate synthase
MNVAIMGCSVNGIGECIKADIGVYGNKTHSFIYKHGKLFKTVVHNQAFPILKELIST